MVKLDGKDIIRGKQDRNLRQEMKPETEAESRKNDTYWCPPHGLLSLHFPTLQKTCPGVLPIGFNLLHQLISLKKCPIGLPIGKSYEKKFSVVVNF